MRRADLPGHFGILPQQPYNGVSIAPRQRLYAHIEESLKKLEVIVEQLEKGDLALEDSLKLFEEGVGMSAACKKELDEAEDKVQMLIKQRDVSLKAEPFLNDKPLQAPVRAELFSFTDCLSPTARGLRLLVQNRSCAESLHKCRVLSVISSVCLLRVILLAADPSLISDSQSL